MTVLARRFVKQFEGRSWNGCKFLLMVVCGLGALTWFADLAIPSDEQPTKGAIPPGPDKKPVDRSETKSNTQTDDVAASDVQKSPVPATAEIEAVFRRVKENIQG